MAEKETLVTALGESGITTAHLSRTFDFPDLPATGDYDQNVLVIAEFCRNLNAYYQAILNGVPVWEYFFRAGQRSSTQQALVLSSLEKRDPEVP